MMVRTTKQDCVDSKVPTSSPT